MICDVPFFLLKVCFLPGTLALGATKGFTRKKAEERNLLTPEDLENLKLAEDLAKTCFEMYAVTSTGLAPEIAYFHVELIGPVLVKQDLAEANANVRKRIEYISAE
ncbi:hypothetical protein B296_00006022, partial [Ensete ventricosum]